MRSRVLPVTLLIFAVTTAGSPAAPVEGFRLARPGWQFEFPRDHGSHDEFRTEWWYFTGHLQTDSGTRLGFEVTFFRVGVDATSQPKETEWDLRHLAIAHFAITDVTHREFRYYEKLNRASRYTAGASAGRMNVFNEGWSAVMGADGVIRLRASASGDAIDLRLRSLKPPAVHGAGGVSVKAEGEGYASHYYSLTRLAAEGTAAVRGKRERVSGVAWLDREWGSSVLREYQVGWDWFAIQLENQTELMMYQIRRDDGTADSTSSASLIFPDGRVVTIPARGFTIRSRDSWTSSRSGATYPLDWLVEVPAFGISLNVRPVMKEQELVTDDSTRITYWEGAVDVVGRAGSTPVRGRGYVELTGYARALEIP